ncbi:hypothetical protein I4U23_023336 [Adineta vaga]|nr:hypothetical protein I4U23_023336 [Adineta vaga]
MEPAFSTLKSTRNVAVKYDHDERYLLLRKRKLHLLVDLDQTIVHTSNSPKHHTSSSEINTFHLDHPVSQTLHAKFRPGLKEFLTNLQPYYVFHIVTFGDRPYANTIVKLIDPNGTFFSHRILSRDECISLTDKSANLGTLFPSGDALVCMIDDREDVWRYAPNVVRVKPYTWFDGVGDINSTYLPKISHTSVINDNDHYLCRLEMILKQIHTKFYHIYDNQSIQNKSRIIPDLKQLIPMIRQQILNSVSLCFSYLLPQDYPLENYRGTIIAQAMGAKVTADLQLDPNSIYRTTHIIAGRHTLKVQEALKNNIKVVTLEWLLDCYEQWERQSEDNYRLTADYNVQQCRLFAEITPHIYKRSHDEMQQQTSSVEQSLLNACSMDIDERFDLCHEISDDIKEINMQPSKRQRTISVTTFDNVKIDNDDDEEEDEAGYVSDEEYLSDDEVPRGWQDTRKRR